MKISSALGDFKIIQTTSNRDELLILGSWNDLVKSFDSTRAFLVCKETQQFGVYLCKQECVEFMSKAIQQIESQWEGMNKASALEHSKYLA